MSTMSEVESISIGGIVLDNIMFWDDEFKYVPKKMVAERTLSGVIVTQSYIAYGGRPVTLTGDQNRGWQKRSTVESLLTLAGTGDYSFPVIFMGANASPILTLTCRFRGEEEPSIEFAPVTPVENPGSDFWYTGSIKLITV